MMSTAREIDVVASPLSLTGLFPAPQSEQINLHRIKGFRANVRSIGMRP
jgi:hypothetical protein